MIILNIIIYHLNRLDGKQDEVDCASLSAGSLGESSSPTAVQTVQNTGMFSICCSNSVF